jgi:hypothetical protein
MAEEYDVSIYHDRDNGVKRPVLYIESGLVVVFALEAFFFGVLPPLGRKSDTTLRLPFHFGLSHLGKSP